MSEVELYSQRFLKLNSHLKFFIFICVSMLQRKPSIGFLDGLV